METTGGGLASRSGKTNEALDSPVLRLMAQEEEACRERAEEWHRQWQADDAAKTATV